MDATWLRHLGNKYQVVNVAENFKESYPPLQ